MKRCREGRTSKERHWPNSLQEGATDKCLGSDTGLEEPANKEPEGLSSSRINSEQQLNHRKKVNAPPPRLIQLKSIYHDSLSIGEQCSTRWKPVSRRGEEILLEVTKRLAKLLEALAEMARHRDRSFMSTVHWKRPHMWTAQSAKPRESRRWALSRQDSYREPTRGSPRFFFGKNAIINNNIFYSHFLLPSILTHLLWLSLCFLSIWNFLIKFSVFPLIPAWPSILRCW